MSDILRAAQIRNMRKIIVSLSMVFAFGFSAYSQTQAAFIKAADEAFLDKDFYSALSYYTNALEFDEDRLDILFNAAESARLFDSYKIAEKRYQEVIDKDGNSEYPSAQFWVADMKQTLGKYNEAKTEYELYLSQNNDDDIYLSQKALKEIKACEWASTLEAKKGQNVTINKMGGNVNTPYSEFGGLKDGDDFYYSSLRFENQNTKSNPGRVYSKVLSADNEVGGDVFIDNDAATGIHAAHTAFNTDKSMMYFTKCKYVTSADIQCHLYRVNTTDETSESEKLPAQINIEDNTSTQPHVAYHEDLGGDVLYYVSDRDGGKGKLDIWMSAIATDGSLGNPINLSSINSSEDDVTPFYHSRSSTLYFSSNGYMRLGGYDVFKSRRSEGSFGDAVHMGMPLNTSYDDVYFVLDDSGENAIFSSNRIGSFFLDSIQEACCYDIYEAEIIPIKITLDAQTFDKVSLGELTGATVKVYDLHDNSLIAELTSQEFHNHKFELDAGINYMIVAEKDPFVSDTLYLDTRDVTESQDIVKKLFLGYDYLNLDVFTFDQKSRQTLIGTRVQLMDLSDNSVQDITIDNKNANDFHFKIIPGRSYKLIATKSGFNTATDIVDSGVALTSNTIIRNMYLKKRDLNIFLPLALFFDNDHPDPSSYRKLTSKTYSETYFPYINRKSIFAQRTQKDQKNGNKSIAKQNMEDFFEYDVQGGFNKLNSFLSALLDNLNKGYKFDITVKGHASPLAATRYNLNLGQRRVVSVRNEMNKYMDGAFKRFFENGQLKITDVSIGEVQAPKGISDKKSDSTRSIYSIEASKERRVEIIKISSIEN